LFVAFSLTTGIHLRCRAFCCGGVEEENVVEQSSEANVAQVRRETENPSDSHRQQDAGILLASNNANFYVPNVNELLFAKEEVEQQYVETTKVSSSPTSRLTTARTPTRMTTPTSTSASVVESYKETIIDLNQKNGVTMVYAVPPVKAATTTKQGTTETQELQPESEQVKKNY
jgi:hypothetical protein